MKKQAGSILASSSLVVMLAVASARAGSSTRIEADVPFDFMVAGKSGLFLFENLTPHK